MIYLGVNCFLPNIVLLPPTFKMCNTKQQNDVKYC